MMVNIIIAAVDNYADTHGAAPFSASVSATSNAGTYIDRAAASNYDDVIDESYDDDGDDDDYDDDVDDDDNFANY
ncbi:hypothetical protein DPMN_073562 [Dreissena polymorpha]|uniref:Uncharacterized protein n=1 Tax=Dreissena polymorpha TaxID=45954 RepID=A0A9D4HE67_DREPO|nr:hypothetical protein DPMN_073562 [Dreissena polymorpha]